VTLGLFDPAFLGGLAAGGGGYDADAQAYITAVEAADGQSLETAVKDAINAFFVGCKSDGIFNAIKASCILAGARTLSGALVPLVSTMPAPTNVGGNFVAGDYNRKTGLKGDGSTKYLDSNRADNADPQNSIHLSIHKSSISTGAANYYIGSGLATHIRTGYHRNRNNAVDTVYIDTTGFCGMSRSNSSNYTFRSGAATSTITATSNAPATQTHHIFKRADSVGQFIDARVAFYSIGESLDLTLLDARVSTLMSDLAAAIP
jgi:hypothetical protein